jgi:adenosine deaminase
LKVTRELLHALPKTDLHVHLDGSLRTETMIELAREYGKPLPATQPDALRAHMVVADARNLVDYLARFEITLSVLQTADALERVAYELAEDSAAENVRYLEVRYSPLLSTAEGMRIEEAVEAPLRGLQRAERDFSIRSGLIICALRHMEPEVSLELAELAVAYKGRGVVAFDLAGPEDQYPPKRHLEAFRHASKANLALTIHAGEAYGPESIGQAIHTCGARRIGHGTTLIRDESLLAYVRDFRIPIEICLTSNAQTRAVPRLEDHPARAYYERGVTITLSTDNRLMSGTTVTHEYEIAHEKLGLDWGALCAVARMGFESGFLPLSEKQVLLERVDAEVRSLTAATAPT